MKLEDTLGKTISDFCQNGYTDTTINHCAHFVCHFLELDFEMTCRKLTGHQQPGANVRVHEVFRNCPKVGKFADWQGTGQVFAFVTKKANVDLEKKEMKNIPQKHIGIYDGTHIYHYANSPDKVIRMSPKEFFDYFEGIYAGEQGLFYGTIPGTPA